jgi:elongation factor Ts
MAVTAAMIKELRERTGVGMSTCKSALVEADGNIDKAIEILREKGQATAVKKQGRIASEGLSYAFVSDDQSVGVVVEVNSETDFVAKNEKFQNYVNAVAQQAVKTSATDLEAFMADKWILDETKTVQDGLVDIISVIGENLKIRRFEKIVNTGDSYLVSYLHAGGKIAVLVELKTESKDAAALTECGKNLAMQIASMSPKFVTNAEISDEFKESEKKILTEQAKNDPKNAGKPDNIIEKMIIGRLNKEFKEMCLVDQEYVKEDKMTVKQYLENVSKEVGTSVEVKKFVRFETGEGIEKKEEDFAAEVAKAMAE